jgi:hypothetical protein
MNKGMSSVGIHLYSKVKDSIFEKEPIEKTAVRDTDFGKLIEDKIEFKEFPEISDEDVKAICEILYKSLDIELIIKQLYVYQSGMDKSIDEIREDFLSLFPGTIKLKNGEIHLGNEDRRSFLLEVFEILDEGIQIALNREADEGSSGALKALDNRRHFDVKNGHLELKSELKNGFDEVKKILDTGFKEYLEAYNKSENDKYMRLNALASYDEVNEELPINHKSLFAEANSLYLKRISGENVINDFSELITKIEISLSKEHNPYELQKLLSWAYHQYAISLQNTSNNYFQAKLMLLNACTIRSKLNDPEYVISLFQLFMNAYQASNKHNWEIDDLAPNGWRHWMVNEMEGHSKILEKIYRYDLYSTNLHNLGFLYQFLAEKSVEGKIDEGYLSSAIKCYKEALRIRMERRDMRLVSQTTVRISKTYLLLIKCINNKMGEEHYSEIQNYINYVKQFYERFPQEEFRYSDLVQLKEELDKYHTC